MRIHLKTDANDNDYLEMPLSLESSGGVPVVFSSIHIENVFTNQDFTNHTRHAFVLEEIGFAGTENNYMINGFVDDYPYAGLTNKDPEDFYISQGFSIEGSNTFGFRVLFEPYENIVDKFGDFEAKLVIEYSVGGINKSPIIIHMGGNASFNSVLNVNGIPKANILSFFNIGKTNVISIH